MRKVVWFLYETQSCFTVFREMGYLGPQLNQSVPTTQAKVEGNAIVSTPENSVQSVWILQQVGEEI